MEGGYYADVEAECQVFHICGNDGNGGLTKYSFLCPNGTIFQQQYFVCDWWFNVDCPEAESFYSLNEEVAAAASRTSGQVRSEEEIIFKDKIKLYKLYKITQAAEGAGSEEGSDDGAIGGGEGEADEASDYVDVDALPGSTGGSTGGQRGRNRLGGGVKRRGGVSASGHSYLSPSLPPPEDYEDTEGEDLSGYGNDLGRYTG